MHTFENHHVMSVLKITKVSRLSEHKSLTMNLRYSHLASPYVSNAVNLLDTS